MTTTNSLPQLLHYFFHDWMAAQRNASRHTIISYRDCWRLFLRFVAERHQRNVARLGLADLTAQEVVAFLDHIEKDRRATIATRNCRRRHYTAFSVSSPAASRLPPNSVRVFCVSRSSADRNAHRAIWNLKK